MGYYVLDNKQFRTGDCLFMRDNGAIAWTNRLSQAGPKYANSIDVVPTHTGLFIKDSAVYTYDGVVKIIDMWGSEIRYVDPASTFLGQANNCPGILQVRRPAFMNTPSKQGGCSLTPAAGLTGSICMINAHDFLWKAKDGMIGKSQYDWAHVISSAVQMLGVMRGNFIQVLVTEALKRLNAKGSMVCSEFVMETYSGIMCMFMNYGWYLPPPTKPQMVAVGAVGSVIAPPVGMPGYNGYTIYPAIMNCGSINPVTTKVTPWHLKQYLYGLNILTVRPGGLIYDPDNFWTFYPP
jgi:hypothetical protein